MTALSLFSGQSLAHALGWSLLHFCWQGTIGAILLACVLGLLNRRSSQLRYLTACGALALMVVLPFMTFVRLAATPQITTNTVTNSGREMSPAHGLRNDFLETAEPWLDQIAGAFDHQMPWVLAVWFAGVIPLLIRLNIGLIAARKMQYVAAQPTSTELQRLCHDLLHRLGITRSVKLMNSALVQVPTVIGWLRPVVLIPMGCLVGLSAIQIEAILAHELAHIRRHDYLISVFQAVVEALLFYHPAVWWVSKQVRREREHCCDDTAVRMTGDSLAYARALSFLEEHRSSAPVIALGANGGVLAMRIRRLLGRKESPVVSRLAALMLLTVVVAAAGCCIAVVARAQSDGEQHQEIESGKGSQNVAARYQKWLNEDVRWNITPEERAKFIMLTTDDERDEFIKQFWERRNPTPGAAENKFKEEHYRRMAYANMHFAAGMPGWMADRGRIYIAYGPPDWIEAHPSGRANGVKPFEIWHYRSIQEYGPPEHEGAVSGYKATIETRKDVDMTFIDVCNCGDYRLQSIPKS